MQKIHKAGLVLAGIVLGALTVAVAAAQIPDADDVFHGCYGPDGKLRVVESEADCGPAETHIEWNQEGPQGPQGPAGADGDGADGADGAQGPQGEPGPSWELYVEEFTSLLIQDGVSTIDLTCNRDGDVDTAISGGFHLIGDITLVISRQKVGDSQKWEFTVDSNGVNGVTLSATCVDQNP